MYHDVRQNTERYIITSKHMPIHAKFIYGFFCIVKNNCRNKITRDVFFIYCPLCIIKIFLGRYSTILQEIFGAKRGKGLVQGFMLLSLNSTYEFHHIVSYTLPLVKLYNISGIFQFPKFYFIWLLYSMVLNEILQKIAIKQTRKVEKPVPPNIHRWNVLNPSSSKRNKWHIRQ